MSFWASGDEHESGTGWADANAGNNTQAASINRFNSISDSNAFQHQDSWDGAGLKPAVGAVTDLGPVVSVAGP